MSDAFRLVDLISWSPVSRATLNQYHRDGFTVLRKVVGRGTIASLTTAYDQILAAGPADYKLMGGTNPHIPNPSRLHEVFRENEAIEKAGVRAAMLMGVPKAVMCSDMLIYKGPGGTGETPWHQDHAYAEKPMVPAGAMPDLRSTVQIWIPLDDVDAENGCMHFIPGQHRERMLEHEYDPAGRCLRIKDERSVIDLSKAVCCPLSAGDATAHGPNTPHFTPGNLSKKRPRRAYILTFAPKTT
jgi:ectoine hydroxylase-related dioxygenase (phytanoyl-CoA dioxygenase family)